MHASLTFYIVMSVAVTILGLSKGGFAGIGMVSTPMVALVTDPVTAAGLMLPVMLVQDPVAVFLYRRSFDRRLLVTMIPGGAVGIVAAYLLASSMPEWGIQCALGVVSLIFSVWQLVIHAKGAPALAANYSFDKLLGIGAGAAGGFASAVAHAGSPPFQIYVWPKRLAKEVYVGTSVMYFAALNAMKLPSYAALGLFSLDHLLTSAIFVPVAVLSSWLGVRLVRRVDVRGFNFVVTIILLLISFVLLGQAWHEAETARSDPSRPIAHLTN
ncbi:sulfite exporter TauE/SafE family protein [Mesorhizobium comanense]|uniref:sulfite exporter TauE/SafE family protein n=1 Tax=Mesorhizobium comanense TaxID=2502215 RepID=UPI0010F6C15C|nr:sulfite exporter TauE/SafE family protein [Mesorhizobium comanense]